MKSQTKYSHIGKTLNINFPQDVYDHVVNTGVTHSSSICVLYLVFFTGYLFSLAVVVQRLSPGSIPPKAH